MKDHFSSFLFRRKSNIFFRVSDDSLLNTHTYFIALALKKVTYCVLDIEKASISLNPILRREHPSDTNLAAAFP